MERHDRIAELINERGSIRVSELSKRFKVTEETIRRDLEKLEKDGYLRRTHGGAVCVKDPSGDLPFLERETIHVEEKRQVAKEAVKYIEPFDRIILDSSSTAMYVAKELPDMELTVLTNSLKVGMELSTKRKINVHMTGGKLLLDSLCLIGPQAERGFSSYFVDKAFISCKGVDSNWGISDSNEFQALVKKKIIEVSDKVFLLVDHSKFGAKAFSPICQLDDIDTIITNRINSEINSFKQIKEMVKKLIQADQEIMPK